MQSARLSDGLEVWCLRRSEALVLDQHVSGYLDHGVGLSDGDVVIDVGANIGLFGVRAVSRHPGLRVYALEPVPDIHAVLSKNAERYGEGRLIPLRCGASAEPGEARFTYFPNSPALSTADPGAWDEQPGEFAEAVAGQARAAGKALWYARLVPSFLSGLLARHLRSGGREVVAELKTLSQILKEQGIERVDLLKVDCEGAELPALQGILAEDWPKIRRVVVEVHDRGGRLAEISRILASNGFDRLVTAKEEGFEKTRLVNVYATRSEA